MAHACHISPWRICGSTACGSKVLSVTFLRQGSVTSFSYMNTLALTPRTDNQLRTQYSNSLKLSSSGSSERGVKWEEVRWQK